MLPHYKGNLYQPPGEIALHIREGRQAAESCITALSAMRGVDRLTPASGLSMGAKDHIADQGRSGSTGHNGSDQSTPFTRIARYGHGYTSAGENISYGPTTARDIVIQLLIDDGVPTRGHRINIMNLNFTQTGLACGKHPQYRHMCVMVYAKGYIDGN
jgi:uncharacterized protein YkwD